MRGSRVLWCEKCFKTGMRLEEQQLPGTRFQYFGTVRAHGNSSPHSSFGHLIRYVNHRGVNAAEKTHQSTYGWSATLEHTLNSFGSPALCLMAIWLIKHEKKQKTSDVPKTNLPSTDPACYFRGEHLMLPWWCSWAICHVSN